MSLLHSLTPFFTTFKTSEYTRITLPTQFLPVSLSRRQLGSRHIHKFSASSTVRCSAMAIDEGPTSSHLQLQDSLLYSQAFWVSKSIIAWNMDVGDGDEVKIKLEASTNRLPEHVIEKFPHVQDYKVFKVPPALDVKSLLKCQLAVAYFQLVTGLQLPGVLDELFSYNGPLGALFSNEAVALYLWAPTAQVVRAFIYRDPTGLREGCYYVYEVSVYHPSTLRVEKCIANDPYARGLSSDGRRTLLVNLDSEALKPEGWDNLGHEKPNLLSFSDISIYELHVRDFSASDSTIPSDVRGSYLAFTFLDSAGMCHLKRLSCAGITHVHLLPTFQFAGVDDEKDKWKNVDFKMLESLPPDSDEQQAHITAIQNEDGYNWGYNPVLWGVPKGSYATNPNGSCRIIEFRKMVQALHSIGLRVVLDVVYNHLHASGPHNENSVLDKIVPGYYLRRNVDGFIENSTCINNTASEHFMVERLIIDDLLCWTTHYKVDGFRFDLMGHIMKHTMVKARSMLHNLSKEKNGVDGSRIYVVILFPFSDMVKGWDFGEVAKNGRGINASQFNVSGTGIGSFNDRIRDAMLGGSPFGHPLQQGFITGLSLEPNGHGNGTKSDAEHMLTLSKDHIQVGMAANLKDFVLTNYEGQEVKGCEVSTHDGAPVGYASCPTETVNYVSAHDNETLFDIVSLKTPINMSADARCRVNHLATSVIALSQGVPFFHSGDEILRSKSLDRDSYNSGDWFNRLDFSYTSNNWGVGLPPKEKNEKSWPIIKTRLGDPSFKPQKSHILAALENFSSFLSIRYSSPLFRLRTANSIQERVRFHNTGPSSVPGVIVMSIEDGHKGVPGLSQLDPIYSYIIVIVNVRPMDALFTSPALRGRSLQLHPIQMRSTDDIVKDSTYDSSSGCFKIPARTTSVFVEPRET
ncbi:Pullulanase 1 [Forsythia ovata]|uniref:Pullulanase 1 n=1 Tax=Forsythia ovata TaxID=205694 RepID=A0ABD1WH82_9LAMI